LNLHDAKYKINGRFWKLRFVRLRGKSSGWCYGPEAENPCRILIHRGRKGRRSAKRLMGDLIHEVLHAACPQLSHDAVEEVDEVLSRILWDQGFRYPTDRV